jgi:hypothetical protein
MSSLELLFLERYSSDFYDQTGLGISKINNVSADSQVWSRWYIC